MARASYIPQLFSLRLPNPDVIYELLHRAKAHSLIFDPSFQSIVVNCPVPSFQAAEVPEGYNEGTLVPLSDFALDADDVVMIFHTSGSTSGSPKLVPCTLRWVDSMVSKSRVVTRPGDLARQDVSVWM